MERVSQYLGGSESLEKVLRIDYAYLGKDVEVLLSSDPCSLPAHVRPSLAYIGTYYK